MSEPVLVCPAPAKINLFLHVTGRRADGYHTLETAFRLLDHGDEIRLSLRDDGQVQRVNAVAGVPPDSDLTVRAARLLQQHCGCALGVDIAIEKKLPMGGGLGGGSSDAASVLLGLNHLWQLGLTRQQLQTLGLMLGADVPFFVFGRSAVAAGVGEQLTALTLPPSWYVVIEPPVAVPTAEIFSAEDLTRNSEPIIISGSFGQALSAQQAKSVLSATCNDLQPVACKRYPVIEHALDALAEFGEARMSGSGACVFLPCATQSAAENVRDKLCGQWRVWAARGLDQHPLYAFAR